MRRIFLFIFSLSVFFTNLPAHAKETMKPKPDNVFNAKTTTLENGLQIVVVENNRAPVVTHMIWYRVGAADEPRGKSGIAHFLEHLLFKGQNHPQLGSLEAGEFSKIVRKLGGQDNAFTSQDYTAYFQSVASEHLEEMMRMEAGRMTGVNIPEDGFEAEKLVIQEERRQRTDNDPRARMGEQMNEALFPNHPYSIPVIGWMHEIEGLKHEDAMDFYKRYYAPNNAILIVSGDVGAENVFEIAKRTYGILPRGETPDRSRITSPPFIAQTSITLEHESNKEPKFTRIYRVPSYRQNKQHSLALQVLEEIMGSGSTGRLYQALVVDQKFATNIGLGYNSAAWNDGTFSASIIPSTPENLKAAENALDDELRKLIKDGITDAELNGTITRMQADAIYARDSLSGPAQIIGYNMATGSSLDDIETWPAQIETVTKAQVQEAAALYLNPDKPTKTPPVDGILLPEREAQ